MHDSHPKGRALSAVDLRQLALIVSLHEQQSLSEAARALHMTPSAASQSLQRLREHLDDEIVVRRGAAYVPTPFGEGALAAFREILELWSETSSGSAVFDPQSTDVRWSIACTEDFTEIDLNACYAAIATAASGAKLDIALPMGGAAAWSALRASRVDVVLTSEPPPADADDLHAERFPDVQATHCCMSMAHPRVGASLNLSQFAAESHVKLAMPDASESGADPVDEALVAAGYKARSCSAVPTLARWAAIVATTDRLATVTGHQAAVLARHAEGVRSLPLPQGLPAVALPRYMVWHHRTHTVASYRWLRDRLRSFVFTAPASWPVDVAGR